MVLIKQNWKNTRSRTTGTRGTSYTGGLYTPYTIGTTPGLVTNPYSYNTGYTGNTGTSASDITSSVSNGLGALSSLASMTSSGIAASRQAALTSAQALQAAYNTADATTQASLLANAGLDATLAGKEAGAAAVQGSVDAAQAAVDAASGISSTLGTVTAGIGAGISTGTAIWDAIKNSKVDPTEVKNNINDIFQENQNIAQNVSSPQELIEAQRNATKIRQAKYSDLRDDKKALLTAGKTFLDSTLAGAALGTSINAGIGTAIGAGAGAVQGLTSGLTGYFTGKNKANKELAEINNNIRNYGTQVQNVYRDSALDMNRQNNRNLFSNILSYSFGGPLSKGVFSSPQYARRNQPAVLFAEGGLNHTHGGIFDNGLTYFNTGSSHENNPHEGVQIGVDEQGIPNLVEEGETMYNDYVFSDRLTVPKSVRKDMKLKNKKGLTFSDAAKDIAKEAEERPNDPISKRGMDTMLGKLAEVQEDVRFKKQMQDPEFRQQAMMALQQQAAQEQAMQEQQMAQQQMSPEEQAMMAQQGMQPQMSPEEEAMMMQQMGQGMPYAFGGVLKNKFWGGGFQAPTFSFGEEYSLAPVVFPRKTGNADLDMARAAIALENATKINAEHQAARKAAIEREETGQTESPGQAALPTWMRYAPVVGSALQTLSDAFTPRDYSNAEHIEQSYRPVPNISSSPIGGYLRYDPNDINYISNLINAQANATRNAIRNNANGNRATMTAGLLAADYNNQVALGNALMAAKKENQEQRMKVAEYNKGINQFNAQQALQAATTNATINETNVKNYMDAIAMGAKMRDDIDTKRSASDSANRTNLFQNIGNIGTENFAMNQANSNPSLYYQMLPNGTIVYKGNGNTGAFGGMLTVKKKKGKKHGK